MQMASVGPLKPVKSEGVEGEKIKSRGPPGRNPV